MTTQNPPKITVQRVQTIEEFASLRTVWNNLLYQSGSDSLFLTHEWLSVWWNHFSEGRKLLICLFWEDGALIGIAPLVEVGSPGSRRGVKVEFMGEPVSDTHDFILTRRPEECLHVLLEGLRQWVDDWSCLELRLIPEDSPALPQLRRLKEPSAWVLEAPFQVSEQSAPVIDLVGNWEDYFALRSSALRYDVRRKQRRLEKMGEVRLVAHDSPESLSDFLSQLGVMSRERFAQESIHYDSRWTEFYKEAAVLALKQGWLDAVSLQVSGKMAAAHLGFLYKGKLQYHQPSMNDAFREASPGKVLLSQLVQRGFEKGWKTIDLARGTSRYKLEWATRQTPLIRFEVVPKNAHAGVNLLQRRVRFIASNVYHSLCT